MAFSNENFASHYQPAFKDMLIEIKKQIYVICNRFKRTESRRLYNRLYDELYDIDFNRINASGNSQRFHHPVNYNVFTTNYDLSFKKFLQSGNRNYADGFQGADCRGIPTFIDEWADDETDVIRFGKLHGSINYYIREDHSIAKYPTSLNEQDMDDEGITDKMMIYPIGEKYATTTPYFEMLSRLRRTLLNEQVVIVIGYSFRDDPINNAFIDRIVGYNQNFPNFKVILVDPDANHIIQTLPNIIRQSITPIAMGFDEESVNLIRNAIENRHPGDLT
jgi:hypothetical protein